MNYLFIEQDIKRKHCNVYFTKIADDEGHKDSDTNAFCTKERLTGKFAGEFEEGVCHGFAHGITLLSDYWKEVLNELLKKETITFYEEENYGIETVSSYPESIINMPEKFGRHTAHALMVLSKELGFDLATASRHDKVEISIRVWQEK